MGIDQIAHLSNIISSDSLVHSTGNSNKTEVKWGKIEVKRAIADIIRWGPTGTWRETGKEIWKEELAADEPD